VAEPEDTRKPEQIEFWFDFSSGYAYFGAHDVVSLAKRHGLKVLWRPHMLGAAFKVTGVQGLSSTPMKSDYAMRDWKRIARLTGLDFNPPADHPRSSLLVTRVLYWLETHEPEKVTQFVLSTFNAYYGASRDFSDPEVVLALLTDLGLPAETVLEGAVTPAIKSLTRDRSEEGISRGVFGSPFFFVDDEPFWGWDRLPMIEKWIENGGW
jgi:2-hydroxychromene-2-carboxylate isomerase